MTTTIELLKNNLYTLGISCSKYNPIIDYPFLKSQGVEFLITKATQGNYIVDPKLVLHTEGGYNAGQIVGAYHWLDPSINGVTQAKWFLKAMGTVKHYDFICVDVEQNWIDWSKPRDDPLNSYSPNQIDDCVNYFLLTTNAAIKEKWNVIYTRTSFINEWCRPMLTWLPDYPVWLAHFPYKWGVVNCASWDEFKSKFPTTFNSPTLPAGSGWKLWQFTADKFVVPGYTGGCEANFFNGSVKDLRDFFEGSMPADPVVVPPVPAELTDHDRIDRLERTAKTNGWTLL